MKTNRYTANINPFYLAAAFTITTEQRVFFRTESGKSWKSKPDITEPAEAVTTEYYYNYCDSIPNFNGFFGGTCRGEFSYTPAGYIVTKITTINPDHSAKYVRVFRFEPKNND